MKALKALLLLAPALAYADGIPFDATQQSVTVPHLSLTLTPTQQREVATRQRVTLTPEQRTQFTQRWPQFPRIIPQVLPYNWGDCTCLVGHPYAILLPGGAAIAVPDGEADFASRYGVVPSQMPPPPKPKSAWSRFWAQLRGSHSQ